MSQASREFMTALEALIEDIHRQQRGQPMYQRMTHLQVLVLRWISKEGATNMSALAAYLGVRPQTVTSVIDALERSGWVRRVRPPEDRREVRLELTANGQRELTVAHDAFFRMLGDALDDAPATSLRRGAEALRIAATRLAANPPAPRRRRSR